MCVCDLWGHDPQREVTFPPGSLASTDLKELELGEEPSLAHRPWLEPPWSVNPFSPASMPSPVFSNSSGLLSVCSQRQQNV